MIQWYIHFLSPELPKSCAKEILSNILSATQTLVQSSQQLAQFFLTFTELSPRKVYSIYLFDFSQRTEQH